MVRYRIRDVILSEILGRDYYLPEDRNWAEDVPGGLRVHMEDAQASKLIFEVDGREAVVDIYDGYVDTYILVPPEPLPPIAFSAPPLLNMLLGATPIIVTGSIIAVNEAIKPGKPGKQLPQA